MSASEEFERVVFEGAAETHPKRLVGNGLFAASACTTVALDIARRRICVVDVASGLTLSRALLPKETSLESATKLEWVSHNHVGLLLAGAGLLCVEVLEETSSDVDDEGDEDDGTNFDLHVGAAPSAILNGGWSDVSGIGAYREFAASAIVVGPSGAALAAVERSKAPKGGGVVLRACTRAYISALEKSWVRGCSRVASQPWRRLDDTCAGSAAILCGDASAVIVDATLSAGGTATLTPRQIVLFGRSAPPIAALHTAENMGFVVFTRAPAPGPTAAAARQSRIRYVTVIGGSGEGIDDPSEDRGARMGIDSDEEGYFGPLNAVSGGRGAPIGKLAPLLAVATVSDCLEAVIFTASPTDPGRFVCAAASVVVGHASHSPLALHSTDTVLVALSVHQQISVAITRRGSGGTLRSRVAELHRQTDTGGEIQLVVRREAGMGEARCVIGLCGLRDVDEDGSQDSSSTPSRRRVAGALVGCTPLLSVATEGATAALPSSAHAEEKDAAAFVQLAIKPVAFDSVRIVEFPLEDCCHTEADVKKQIGGPGIDRDAALMAQVEEKLAAMETRLMREMRASEDRIIAALQAALKPS